MFNLKTHNIMDYVIAVVLVLAPYVFDFANVMPARNVFLTLGIGLAIYSLITKYYYSIAKIIPLGIHMILDCVAGFVLLVAPSMWNYREALTNGQYAVHIVLGLGAWGLVAVTRTRTEAAKTPEEHRATDGTHGSVNQGPQVRV